MSSEWELDEGIKSIKSAWRREHTARCNLEKMLKNAESENAKLRELCDRFAEYISYDSCEGCVDKSRCDNDEIDECWQRTEIRELARELGIEV